MRFDSKIAIVVRGDLAAWQRLNVTAFLASGVAAGCGETIGKPYEDGSGHGYLEMFRQPVLVYAADGPGLAWSASGRPPGTCPPPSIPRTCSPRATTRPTGRWSGRWPAGDLRLAGVAVYGPRNAVDKVCKGLTLHS